MSDSIKFVCTDLDTYAAWIDTRDEYGNLTGAKVVARIHEIEEDSKFRIVYFASPAMLRKGAPKKTTRTVDASLDTVQARITARGWTL